MADVRIVLQTGATALTAALFATAFTYGAVFAGLVVGVVGSSPEEGPVHRLMLPMVPVVFVGVAIGMHVWTWRSRASDVWLTDAGLRVEGGRWSGGAWRWSEIDVDQSRIVFDPNARVTINGHDTYRRGLVLALLDGREVELGSSFDDDEQASFERLLLTIRSRVSAPPVAPAPVGVLACPACGAPVAPRSEAMSACWRCDTAVPTPEGLRARVAAGEALARRRGAVEASVRAWLAQPPAGLVNRWLAAVFAVRYGLPLLLCLGSSQWMAILAGAWTLGKVASLRIVDRFAYRSLMLDWAARAPQAVGAPSGCRVCGSPLSPGAGEVLTRCPACEADNVLGLDVAASAAVLSDARREIEVFIAEQADRRQGPWWAVVGGAALTVGLALWATLGGG